MADNLFQLPDLGSDTQKPDPISIFEQSGKTPGPVPDSVPKNASIVEKEASPIDKLTGTTDYVKGVSDFLSSADVWAQDPYKYGKDTDYGAGYKQANFYRYYTHPEFKKLGFSPFRDNELIYNKNTGAWSDFLRSTTQFVNLFGTGFKSLYQSGDKSSQEMERAMSIGSSSRGGLTQFSNNLFLNAAFTIGIGAEILAEDLALTAVTAISGGSTSTLLAARLGVQADRLKSLFQFGKNLKSSAEWVKDLANINRAREFWQNISLAKAAKNTANFLNPLEHTFEYAKNFGKGFQGFKDLEMADKIGLVRHGFGSFYRDMRVINAVVSEAMMEGASERSKLNEDLIKQFYIDHDKEPTREEALKINEASKNAGFTTSLLNLPGIYITDKLVFDKLFEGFRPASALSKDLVEGSTRVLGREASWKIGENAFNTIEKSFKKSAINFLKTSEYVPWSKRYILGNLSDALQESTQDIISSAAGHYYTGVYKDPQYAGFYNGALATIQAIKEQFTMQGFETFAGGWGMGFIAQAPQALIFDYAAPKFQQLKNPEQYKKLQERKIDRENAIINAANHIAKNPIGYFDSLSQHAVRSRQLADEIEKAQNDGDQKKVHDLKEDLYFNHLFTLASTNKLDLIDDHIKSLLDLSDQELSEAFNEKPDEAKNIRRRLEEAATESENFAKRYDLFSEKLPNPFNPYIYDQIKQPEKYVQELDNYNTWEAVKRDAILSHSFYDKTFKRMKSIYDDVMLEKPVAKANSSDFNILFDHVARKDEKTLLRNEITALKQGDQKQKAEATKKEKKLESLKELDDLILNYKLGLEQRNANKITDKELDEKAKLLYTSYKDFLKVIANISDDKHVFSQNIDNSFVKLRDYYQLQFDSDRFASAINLFNNPSFITKYAERLSEIQKVAKDNYSNYIKEGVKKLTSDWLDNSLLNQLMNIGVTIDPADSEKLFVNGESDISFFTVDGQPIDPQSSKYKDVKEIVDGYQLAKSEKAPEEVKPVGEKPASETIVKEAEITADEKITNATPFNAMPLDLQNLLVNAFREENQQRESLGEPVLGDNKLSNNEIKLLPNFHIFVKTSGTTTEIISDYNSATNRKKENTPITNDVTTTSNVMIKSQDIIDRLLAEGYTKQEIDKMTSVEASTIINNLGEKDVVQEEAKTKENATSNNIIELVKNTKTPKEYLELESELYLILSNKDKREESGLTSEVVEQILETKKKEIFKDINFDVLQEDMVFLASNNKYYKVIKRTANQIQSREVGQTEGAIRTINRNDAPEQIRFIYQPGMEEIVPEKAVEATPEDKKLSNETISTSKSEDVNSEASAKEDYEKAKALGNTQAQEDFLNNLNKC